MFRKILLSSIAYENGEICIYAVSSKLKEYMCESSIFTKFFFLSFFVQDGIRRCNRSMVLGVQISSVRFPKDGSSCCEWFIVTADFDGFREIKHLLIIFSLYRFEFQVLSTISWYLDFCVWNVEFCVNQAAFAGGFDFLL